MKRKLYFIESGQEILDSQGFLFAMGSRACGGYAAKSGAFSWLRVMMEMDIRKVQRYGDWKNQGTDQGD